MMGSASGVDMKESLKNKPAIIYCAINTISKKKYVGITCKVLARRVSEHKIRALKYKDSGHFYNAIRKHGLENFNWYILSRWDNYQDALDEEVRVIALINSEYNMTRGGEGTSGWKMPRHIVERISEKRRGKPGALRGIKHSEERKQRKRQNRIDNPEKYIVPWTGKKRDPSIGEKISIAATGRKLSESHIKNLSLSHMGNKGHWTGKKRDEETKEKISNTKKGCVGPRRKPIVCVNDGNKFSHAQEAVDFYRIPGLIREYIGDVCRGKKENIYGIKFKFMEI